MEKARERATVPAFAAENRVEESPNHQPSARVNSPIADLLSMMANELLAQTRPGRSKQSGRDSTPGSSIQPPRFHLRCLSQRSFASRSERSADSPYARRLPWANHWVAGC